MNGATPNDLSISFPSLHFVVTDVSFAEVPAVVVVNVARYLSITIAPEACAARVDTVIVPPEAEQALEVAESELERTTQVFEPPTGQTVELSLVTITIDPPALIGLLITTVISMKIVTPCAMLVVGRPQVGFQVTDPTESVVVAGPVTVAESRTLVDPKRTVSITQM